MTMSQPIIRAGFITETLSKKRIRWLPPGAYRSFLMVKRTWSITLICCCKEHGDLPITSCCQEFGQYSRSYRQIKQQHLLLTVMPIVHKLEITVTDSTNKWKIEHASWDANQSSLWTLGKACQAQLRLEIGIQICNLHKLNMASLSLHHTAEYSSQLLVKTSVLLPKLITPATQSTLLAFGNS